MLASHARVADLLLQMQTVLEQLLIDLVGDTTSAGTVLNVKDVSITHVLLQPLAPCIHACMLCADQHPHPTGGLPGR